MKRAIAIGHLVELAEVATEALRFGDTEIGWPLEEMWAGGELLGPADTLEVGSVVLVLDVPAEELAWLARHPAGERIGDQLRLGKRPMLWSYRPVGRPVWGPDHRHLVRFWTAQHGTDHTVIDALRSHRLDDLAIVEPTDEELTTQMPDELDDHASTSAPSSTTTGTRPGDASTRAPTNPPKTTSGEPPPPSPTSSIPLTASRHATRTALQESARRGADMRAPAWLAGERSVCAFCTPETGLRGHGARLHGLGRRAGDRREPAQAAPLCRGSGAP